MNGNRRVLWLSLALTLVIALLAGAGPAGVAISNAAGETVREMWFATNDLVYDPASQRIYASVPESYGSLGNHVAVIDPCVQPECFPAVESLVPAGSDPYKLALSPDSQYLYVALRGTAGVARLDMASGTKDLEFTLGSDPFWGPWQVQDMAVAPGNPAVVAISRQKPNYSPRHEGVAIFENGVQRPLTTATHTGSNEIEFAASAERLYGYNNETSEFGFRRMDVTTDGVSVVDVTSNLISGYGVEVVYEAGRLYATTGATIDPEQRQLLGTYPSIWYAESVRPDAAANRVSFLVGTSLSSHYQIKVYDLQNFAHLGTIDITTVVGRPSSLVRWGSDGLAFRTDAGQVFTVQSPLIAGGPVATPPSTPVPTNTPLPTNTPVPTPTFTPTPTNTPTPSPTPVPTLHVFDLDATTSVERGYWGAMVSVGVHDAFDNPIAGATVTGQWQNGYSANTWCTTGADGRCTVSTGTVLKKQSSVTFAVSNVAYGAYIYNGGANHDADGDSNGTIITVRKPR